MITPITKENIKKIQRHRYYDEQATDIDVLQKNKILNSCIKKNLQRLMVAAAKSNNMETVVAVDLDTLGWAVATDYLPMDVSLSPQMEQAFLTSGNTFIAMHNHPNNATFSIADVMVLVHYPNLQTIFMCTNNCDFIEMLDKGNKNFKPLVKVVLSIVTKLINKNIINRHGDAKHLISFLVKSGFIYEKYNNN